METATNENALSNTDGKDTAVADTVTEAAAANVTDEERAQQEEQWKAELNRLEYEIQTLRNVLIAKMNEAGELKRKLGITPMVELKQDFVQGIQTLKESETVTKTAAAFKTFGEYASRKIGDLRNSNTFKSVEEKVGGAYTSVKKRVSRPDLDAPASPTEELESASLNSPTVDVGEELTNMLPETAAQPSSSS